MEKNKKDSNKRIFSAAFSFIILMGIVSMFSDMTHEAANSINGSFESFLGAPTIVITLVGGIASLLGFGLRLFIGYLADKTKKYWVFTIIGYFLDLIFVPLLALVPENGWILAVSFIILEKIGKAIKKPAKDTLISFASAENGTGKSFAIGEALDQLGAVIGPVILTITYLIRSDFSTYDKYRLGYAVLAIPAIICFIILAIAFFKYRHPEQFEKEANIKLTNFLRSKTFIIFLVGALLFGFGFLDNFGLISKHLSDLSQNGSIAISTEYLPLLYSYAMLIDAVAALFFGYLFDKVGMLSLVFASIITIAYPFFIFYINTTWSIFIGLTLWGVGIGSIESIMKSCVTVMSGKNQRGRAFGTYEFIYGIATFASSFLIAYLYDNTKLGLCIVTSIMVFASSIMFYISYKNSKAKTVDIPNMPAEH